MTHYSSLFALLLTGCLLAACGAERAPIASSVADAPAKQVTPATPEAEPENPEQKAEGDAAETACIDPSKVDKTRMCTMDYTPVCGCDGKTHSNACKAGAAGVTQWTKGACDATH